MHGWHGRILRINLTTGTIHEQIFSLEDPVVLHKTDDQIQVRIETARVLATLRDHTQNVLPARVEPLAVLFPGQQF